MHAASLLIPRVGNEQAVAECWERFVQREALPGRPVREVVRASWLRCRNGAVDPARATAPGLSEDRLRELRAEHRLLYDAARPIIAQLRDVLRESGSLIMLTTPTGTVIDLHGDSQVRQLGERVNLAQGGHWIEDVIGTNAIGTAIAARQPVQIYGSEHYCVDVKRWTCAAAPVLDTSGRLLLGVVDVSGVKDSFHGHTLGLVIAAAKQIESVIANQELMLRARLLERATAAMVRHADACTLVFDHRGRLVRGSPMLQTVREAYGIPLSGACEERFAALDLGLSADERGIARPGWLNPDWLQTVRDGDSLLGTVVVIPVPARVSHSLSSARAHDASGAEPGDGSSPFAEVVGRSPLIVAAIQRARRLAPLDLPLLLLGETGVGKEVFARAIHRAGARPDAPFIAVNCGALTRELLASELFGYVDGAFTGARRAGQAGKFELADGGTLFLDEIGEMPLDMQPHLLRVLQDGIVVRLGDNKERRVAVRIIAATNRDLRREVGTGRFREDLFHRLCVASLQLPSLRERGEDIDIIVDALNARLARKYGCARKALAAEVRSAFRTYHWPGNVRELQNVFEMVFALSDGDTIAADVLPEELVGRGRAPDSGCGDPARAFRLADGPVQGQRLDELERQAIMSAIDGAQGNISRAARMLGISRSTLYVKLANIQPWRDSPKRH